MWRIKKNQRAVAQQISSNHFAKKRTVKVVKKEVKKALMKNSLIELKRQRTQSGATLSTTPAIINLFTGNTQGLGDLNVRVGDRLRMQKLDISGRFTYGDSTQIIRAIVFLWHDDSTVGMNPPTDQQLLDDTTSNDAVLYGDINNDGSNPKGKKFQILYDKRFYLNQVSKPQIDFQFKRTWKYGKTVGFSAGASTGLGIPYLLLVSDSSVASHPSYYMNVKIHYNDL